MDDFIETMLYLFLLVPIVIVSAVFLIIYFLLILPVVCIVEIGKILEGTNR